MKRFELLFYKNILHKVDDKPTYSFVVECYTMEEAKHIALSYCEMNHGYFKIVEL